MMILRDFKKEDAQTIAGWIRSEEELYKWSADRFNKYPLLGDDKKDYCYLNERKHELYEEIFRDEFK